MGKSIAILKGKKRGQLTQNLLHAHVEHLRKITLEGKLSLCGPFQDNDKAMQVIHSETMQDAEAILKSDPFVREGYYASYDLYELIEANESNNWLMSTTQTQQNLQTKSK